MVYFINIQNGINFVLLKDINQFKTKMNDLLFNAIKKRRSYYSISDQSPVSDEEIEDILKECLLYVPSAFNSQSTRVVLLLHDNHKKLWEITKEILRQRVPEDKFQSTESKMNAFAAGYGTVLFYEDQAVVQNFQNQFPSYKDNFSIWSNQASAMHQFAIWIMLEDRGFGASLQHYNPLIDQAIQKEWGIDSNWKLIAEMPFGLPDKYPEDKDFLPVEDRILVFK